MVHLESTKSQSSQHNQQTDISVAIRKINIFLEEFAKVSEKNHSLAKMENPLSHQSWRPPDVNNWKLNSDASWCDEEGAGELGGPSVTPMDL